MAEVHKLCVTVLGSDILRSASAAFGRASAGNPMFLRALIEQAQRQNHLVNRNGVWMLSGEPPAADQVLADVVEAELAPLSTEERRVLEIVALAEPLPLGVLRELAKTSDIDAMETRSIVTVGSAPERLVCPAHPLYGEIVRQSMPRAGNRTLRRSIVELMDSAPSSAEGLLRYVSWAMECGAHVDDRRLLRAAILANKLHQTSLALAMARAVTEPKLALAARIEMARARSLQGDQAQARELLEGALDTAMDVKTVTSAALLPAQLKIRAGTGAQGLRSDAEAWSRAIDRIAADTKSHLGRILKLSRIGSQLLWLYASNLEGSYENVEPKLQQIVEDPFGSGETRLIALSLLGELLTATGRPELGAQANSRALEIVGTNEDLSLTYHEFVVIRYAISLTCSGRWDDVHDLITRYLEQSPQTLAYLGGTINLVTGLVLARQGLLHSALGQLSPAIEAFRETDPEQLLPLALGLGAYAASLMGEHSLAREYAGDFIRLPYRGSRQLFLLGHAHTAAAQMAMGGGTASRDELRQVAAEARDRGMGSVQLLALELAVRLGDTTAAGPLSDAAEANDSVAAGILYRFARATIEKDPERLRIISDEAIEARYFLMAADSLATAVSVLEAQGSGQRARQFQIILSERVARLEGNMLYHLEESDKATDLTRREKIIATLVFEGRSNKEIAEVLSVSVRTVEGHLYRIFAKLGISHRRDITARHVGRCHE